MDEKDTVSAAETEQNPEEVTDVAEEKSSEEKNENGLDGKISTEQLESELNRTRKRSNFYQVLRNTIYILITVIAAAVIIAIMILPILRVTGESMTNTLQDGDIVVALNSQSYKTGEVIALYYNNEILLKRVIATAGQWVDIDDNGNVSVDGKMLDEPYVSEKALGKCDIELPYQVPEGRIFVMGDHRSTSVDSRNTTVGCIAEENVIGRILFCAWPLKDIGVIK